MPDRRIRSVASSGAFRGSPTCTFAIPLAVAWLSCGCQGQIASPRVGGGADSTHNGAAPGAPGFGIDDPGFVSGAALYSQHCADCHGDLSESVKKGKTPEAIQWALGAIREMKPLGGSLDDGEIEAISYALDYERIGTCGENAALGFNRLSRLTREEYFYALSDLLQVSSAENFDVPFEAIDESAFANNSFYLSLDANHWTGYWNTARTVADRTFAANSDLARQIVACEGQPATACLRPVLADFVARAHRRPAADDYLDGLLQVFEQNRAHGDFVASAKSTIVAVLMAPGFLFKNHAATRDTAGGAGQERVFTLDGYQLASRLAFLLWRSVPDPQLLDKARSGVLADRSELLLEAQRMLDDPRAVRMVDGFFSEWSALKSFSLNPAPEGISESLKEAFANETLHYFRDFFMRNAPLDQLLLAGEGFFNKETAAHYDLPGEFAGEFKKAPAADRIGYLAHGSFLTHAYSPTARGKWILTHLMCKDPGDPPVLAEFDEAVAAADATFKEKLSIHAADPACRGCHAEMDPIGLSLERFGRQAQRRSNYADGKPVDATGTLYGRTFDDHVGLARILSERNDLKACFTQQLVSYAVGRFLPIAEKCAANALAYRTLATGKGIKDLLLEVVGSQMFSHNARGE